MYFNPTVRADTFLVDTETGRIWRVRTVTEVVGEPSVWLPEERMDNAAELHTWLSRQRFKPTSGTTPQQRRRMLARVSVLALNPSQPSDCL